MKLDGTEKIKPTPFDAHEQVARVQHEEAPKERNSVHSGLRAVDPEDAVTEYPKAVDHVENPYAEGHLEPVLVNSREEEVDFKKAQEADKSE
jgi:hypothetical protein